MTVSTTPFKQVYAFTKLLESLIDKNKVEKIYILPYSQPADLSLKPTSDTHNVQLLQDSLHKIFPGYEFITLTDEVIESLGKARLVFNQRDVILPDILFDDNALIVNYALPAPDKKMLVYSGVANFSQFIAGEDREFFNSLKREEGLMFLGHLYKQYSAQFVHIMEINDLVTVDTSSIANEDPLVQYEKMHEIATDESNYSTKEVGEFWISNNLRELDLYTFFKIWGERPIREGSWFFIPQTKASAEEIVDVPEVAPEEE